MLSSENRNEAVLYSSDFTFMEPQVHAYTYDPTTGVLKQLPVQASELDLKAYSIIDSTQQAPPAPTPVSASPAPAVASTGKSGKRVMKATAVLAVTALSYYFFPQARTLLLPLLS